MNDKTYDDGKRDGQINAIEAMVQDHKGRLDNHSNRLRILERIVWVVTGGIFLMKVLPDMKLFLGALGS